MKETESVRISKDLKQELKKLAHSMRPRTAIQYLLEDAVEQYLDRVAEEGGPAYQVKKPAKKTRKKKSS
jgi:predicted transcriptional regulator